MAVRVPFADSVLAELQDVCRNVVRLDKANRNLEATNRDLEAQLAERTRELAEALAREDELAREYDLLKARQR